MILRAAKAADAAAVAAVQVRASYVAYGDLVAPDDLAEAAGTSVERWTATLAGEATAVVAEHEGALVGFAAWGRFRREEVDAGGELYAIYVLPEAQGAGVGTRLLVEAVAGLRADGHRDAALWVLARNAQGRSFYEAAGWSEDREGERDSPWGQRVALYRRAL